MTPEYIRTLLKLTKVANDNLIAATISHLCEGVPQDQAGEPYGIQQEAISRLVRRINKVDAIVKEAMEIKSNDNS